MFGIMAVRAHDYRTLRVVIFIWTVRWQVGAGGERQKRRRRWGRGLTAGRGGRYNLIRSEGHLIDWLRVGGLVAFGRYEL